VNNVRNQTILFISMIASHLQELVSQQRQNFTSLGLVETLLSQKVNTKQKRITVGMSS